MKDVTLKEVEENPGDYKLCCKCAAINSIDNKKCTNDDCNHSGFDCDKSKVKEIAQIAIECEMTKGKSEEEAESVLITVSETSFFDEFSEKIDKIKIIKTAYMPPLSARSKEEIGESVKLSMFNSYELTGQYSIESAADEVTDASDKNLLLALKERDINYIEI